MELEDAGLPSNTNTKVWVRAGQVYCRRGQEQSIQPIPIQLAKQGKHGPWNR